MPEEEEEEEEEEEVALAWESKMRSKMRWCVAEEDGWFRVSRVCVCNGCPWAGEGLRSGEEAEEEGGEGGTSGAEGGGELEGVGRGEECQVREERFGGERQ